VILPLQSHTGEALAKAFQSMLLTHGLENKVCLFALSKPQLHISRARRQILAFNGDNATSNDKQTSYLDGLPNSFEAVNRVRCFNHTMQLSAKALMKPFDTPISPDDSDVDEPTDIDDALSVEGDDKEGDGEDIDFGSVSSDDQDERENGASDDPLEGLDADAQQQLLDDTAAVRTMLDKVCGCSRF
jgi:hypothetical protein